MNQFILRNRRALLTLCGMLLLLVSVPLTVLISQQIQQYRSGAQAPEGLFCEPGTSGNIHPEKECRSFAHPTAPTITPEINGPDVVLRVQGSLCFREDLEVRWEDLQQNVDTSIFLGVRPGPTAGDARIGLVGGSSPGELSLPNTADPICSFNPVTGAFRNENNPLRFSYTVAPQNLRLKLEQEQIRLGNNECPGVYLHLTGGDGADVFNIFRWDVSSLPALPTAVPPIDFRSVCPLIAVTCDDRSGTGVCALKKDVPPAAHKSGCEGKPAGVAANCSQPVVEKPVCDLRSKGGLCLLPSTPGFEPRYRSTIECTRAGNLDPLCKPDQPGSEFTCDISIKPEPVCRDKSIVAPIYRNGSYTTCTGVTCPPTTQFDRVCDRNGSCLLTPGTGKSECDPLNNEQGSGKNPACPKDTPPTSHTECSVPGRSCILVENTPGNTTNKCSLNQNDPATGVNPACPEDPPVQGSACITGTAPRCETVSSNMTCDPSICSKVDPDEYLSCEKGTDACVIVKGTDPTPQDPAPCDLAQNDPRTGRNPVCAGGTADQVVCDNREDVCALASTVPEANRRGGCENKPVGTVVVCSDPVPNHCEGTACVIGAPVGNQKGCTELGSNAAACMGRACDMKTGACFPSPDPLSTCDQTICAGLVEKRNHCEQNACVPGRPTSTQTGCDTVASPSAECPQNQTYQACDIPNKRCVPSSDPLATCDATMCGGGGNPQHGKKCDLGTRTCVFSANQGDVCDLTTCGFGEPAPSKACDQVRKICVPSSDPNASCDTTICSGGNTLGGHVCDITTRVCIPTGNVSDRCDISLCANGGGGEKGSVCNSTTKVCVKTDVVRTCDPVTCAGGGGPQFQACDIPRRVCVPTTDPQSTCDTAVCGGGNQQPGRVCDTTQKLCVPSQNQNDTCDPTTCTGGGNPQPGKACDIPHKVCVPSTDPNSTCDDTVCRGGGGQSGFHCQGNACVIGAPGAGQTSCSGPSAVCYTACTPQKTCEVKTGTSIPPNVTLCTAEGTCPNTDTKQGYACVKATKTCERVANPASTCNEALCKGTTTEQHTECSLNQSCVVVTGPGTNVCSTTLNDPQNGGKNLTQCPNTQPQTWWICNKEAQACEPKLRAPLQGEETCHAPGDPLKAPNECKTPPPPDTGVSNGVFAISVLIIVGTLLGLRIAWK